jgi:hypothetical protein
MQSHTDEPVIPTQEESPLVDGPEQGDASSQTGCPQDAE